MRSRVARSQLGASAKDAAKDMADSGSMPDLSRLRDVSTSQS